MQPAFGMLSYEQTRIWMKMIFKTTHSDGNQGVSELNYFQSGFNRFKAMMLTQEKFQVCEQRS